MRRKYSDFQIITCIILIENCLITVDCAKFGCVIAVRLDTILKDQLN
ncbi:unknown [Bacteroides sp. CAG:545]|nr:unknown [Bacteroides sp. CAG:545]